MGKISITPLSFDDTYQQVLQHAKKRKKLLLFPANIHSLRLIHEDKKVRRAFMRAGVVFADGVPLLWLSRLAGNPLPGRVSGTNLVEKILCTPSLRVFLLGSSPSILAFIKKKYRRLNCEVIVGAVSPLFTHKMNTVSNKKILQRLRKTKPDVLFVALGQPKQELWLAHNFSSLPVAVAVGVGSALDILAGKTPRAPRCMQKFGLEWFWRVILEPKRLIKRYVGDAHFLIKNFSVILKNFSTTQ
jgi:N-acetylglucosaminyldiphosphoundecaprenol N-acetyl-beta-D-mannosaminyltransferase